jgi:plastocyanin
MKLARILGILLAGVTLALPFHGIEAGGWASVEIVNGPNSIEAGKPVTFELAVKQHGISPVDWDPLVISASNANTGDSIEETATKADGVGNYTIELTFPSDGDWELTGNPGGSVDFDMGTLVVGQALIDTSSIAAPAGSVIVTITGGMGSGQFEPNTIEIGKGTLVVWQNDSVEGHTVVLENDPRHSGLIGPGAAFAIRFDVPGTYQVSCGPHPNMTATIVVA